MSQLYFSSIGFLWRTPPILFPMQCDLFQPPASNFHTFLAIIIVPTVDHFYVVFFQFSMRFECRWFLFLIFSSVVEQSGGLNWQLYRLKNHGGTMQQQQ